MAILKTKATRNNPTERYEWKGAIMLALYEKGFSDADILNLYRLVDWLMRLPEDLNKQFTQKLIEYEEEKKMPYISSAERYGMEKGMEKGRQAIIQRLLTKRFGSIVLAPEYQERLGNSTSEQLDSWAEKLLDAKSIEDVFRD